MVLLEDKGQKIGQHEEKNLFWRELGIEVVQVPLPVGDYILADNKVMDVIFRKDKRGIPLKKMDFLGTYNVCVDTKRIFRNWLEMCAESNMKDLEMNVYWRRTMELNCMCWYRMWAE